MISKINSIPSFKSLKIKDDDITTQKNASALFDNKYKQKIFMAALATMSHTTGDSDVFLSIPDKKEDEIMNEVIIKDKKDKPLVRIFMHDNSSLIEIIQSFSMLNTLLKTNLKTKN